MNFWRALYSLGIIVLLLCGVFFAVGLAAPLLHLIFSNAFLTVLFIIVILYWLGV